jgi:hypothetical protein
LTDDRIVKTFAALSAKALATHQDRELVIWYLARHLDDHGGGTLTVEELQRAVPISGGNLRRRLHRGQRTFWDIIRTPKGHAVRLRGLTAVCTALDVLPRRSPIGVAIEEFRTLARARAALQATMQQDRVIARATIEGATGASKRTQRRRERCSGTNARANWGRRPYRAGDQLSDGVWVATDHSGTIWINRQLPNTYHNDSLHRLPRAAVRATRRSVQRTPAMGGVAVALRRSFRSRKARKAAQRCKTRDDPHFIDERITWQGRRLWMWNEAVS